jgi:tetraacyldisaccharide 4'-kinase
VSDGTGSLVDASVAGDEPAMLAAQLADPAGGIPVIVARRRFDGGRRAIEECGARCIVLDDGFQHLALRRDLDLLLLDGGAPFGNGRLLPAGPLREPLEAMSRAHAIVITRPDDGEECAEGRRQVQAAVARYCPEAPIFLAHLGPSGLRDVNASTLGAPGHLRGARVFCFAGIARPDRFFRDVASLGADIVGTEPFGDHHRFSGRDLERLAGAASSLRADLLLTTEKDAARIGPGRLPALYALAMEARPENGDELTRLLERAAS